MLLELGADPNALNKMGLAPVHVMLGLLPDMNSERVTIGVRRDAAATSLVQIATLLKDAGADLDATAGHPAVPPSYLAVGRGELDLLCAPPVIAERHTRPAPEARTGLSFCYLPPVVTGVLFDAGAKINVRANGETLLSRAILNGHDAIIDELLIRGADLHQATGRGATALFLAAGMGNTSLVRRLHAAGAAVDTVDTQGSSALEYAARSGKLASVELLIELNADIFTIDKQGANVAFGTICSGIFQSFEEHEACVRLLHARGLDFSAADNDGWTPAHTVVQQLNVYALRLLHNLGVPLNVASVITKGKVTSWTTGQPMLDPNGEPLTCPPGTEGMAKTPADIAAGPMLLQLYALGVIEEAEVRRRLQRKTGRSICLNTATRFERPLARSDVCVGREL